MIKYKNIILLDIIQLDFQLLIFVFRDIFILNNSSNNITKNLNLIILQKTRYNKQILVNLGICFIEKLVII